MLPNGLNHYLPLNKTGAHSTDEQFRATMALLLAHLSHWLMVSYCDCLMSVVRQTQLLQRTSPPKLLAGFGTNILGMILIWPSLKIVEMVQVRCLSRSHRLK